MAKQITTAERLMRAQKMIQKARALPVPEGGLGRSDLSYVAGVRDLLRQAKDFIKFIPQTAGVSEETKAEVKKIYAEMEQVEKELLA